MLSWGVGRGSNPLITGVTVRPLDRFAFRHNREPKLCTGGGDRTHNLRFLKPAPLPVGLHPLDECVYLGSNQEARRPRVYSPLSGHRSLHAREWRCNRSR
jgi:hypothetical protein